MKKTLLGVLLAAVVFAPLHLPTQTNSFPNQDKHHALLRLEDVGPGGSYESLDDLGKLRAIFEYLEGEHVPFHVATIARSKHIQPDGTWYEKGIDDANPDETVKQFIRLLREAQDHGAVLGMHGYTHQYGETKRGDSNQDSGTGFEFHVKDAPETETAEYAADKITKSLAAFDKAGFVPGFWESPHYNDTREQEEVFRSFMGVLYQPDFRSLRAFKDLNFYDTENSYGSSTVGSAYIPAPLSYIQDASSVDHVLTRLQTYRGLGAMYYHPFLEFPSLEAVLESDGKPRVRDGLPEYQYKAGAPSNLHLLIAGFRERGFQWESIYDILPYSPAHRIELPLGIQASDVMIGNVSGSQNADVVIHDKGRIQVFTGNYKWPRNRTQKSQREWLSTSFSPSEQFRLGDVDGDHLDDLLAYDKGDGQVRVFLSNRVTFEQAQSAGSLPGGFDIVQTADLNGDKRADLVLRRGGELWSVLNVNGSYGQPRKIWDLPRDAIVRSADFDGDQRADLLVADLKERRLHLYTTDGTGWREASTPDFTLPNQNVQVLAADLNGDHRADIAVYDAQSGIWETLDSTSEFQFKPLDNLYGPWARGDYSAYAADFDGNDRADIAALDVAHHTIDLSLSFRNPSTN
ncbi:DUF2334 domain-containing protein [Tumebacillus permanentifrigoris]|uniref:VCBS repeat protein n=1 Tax=Tumebacillus permanentifrigoris TaxID=378543 RepID=A0A316DAE6_9BACL|nr:DUF2334 domain-containing protein [Tumebacillus permanentifrigoris]PWK13357.1 VCBS repeat protein [Tumebacillus permanentifrigoris]